VHARRIFLPTLRAAADVDAARTDMVCVFRTKGVPIFENYMRLVMYSFGFEAAWKRRGLEPGDMFFAKVRVRPCGVRGFDAVGLTRASSSR
jgi:hypothetical protein